MSETEASPLFEEAVTDAELMGAETKEETEPPVAEGQTEVPESLPVEKGIAIDFHTLEMESELYSQPADMDFSDFKELSHKEFEDLLEDDPDAATLYQYRQSKFKDHQQRRQKAETMTDQVIQAAAEELVNLVPDIYTDEPEKAGELARFAVDHGMDPTFLNYMTSPNVRIVVPGKKPMLLGKGAMSLVKMIKALHAKSEPRRQPQKPKPRERIASEKTIETTRLTGLQAERHFASLSEKEQEALLRG